MLDKEPEKYATFWSELGRAVKEGLISDFDNREAILEICSFPSTHDPEQPTTLRDYLARMPEGQDAIYYVTGESRSTLEKSPHMEAFRAKGYEVLLLTDPVDEVWVDAVPAFEDKPLASIAKGEVDLGGDERGRRHEAGLRRPAVLDGGHPVRRRQGGAALPPAHQSSAACLVGDPGDLTPTLEKMYRAMGQEPPTVKRILELNPAHPLVTGLGTPTSSGRTTPRWSTPRDCCYGMALLAEGGELADPAAFVTLLSRRLEKSLS